jgi:site-specific DNA-cytosine methylase
MRVLELFSGTKSVGKVCKELGYEVISLDLNNADINIDILKWDYRDYPNNYFDIIWASPPCHTFSMMRRSWIGRKNSKFGNNIITKELLDNDMINNGLPIVHKTLEIIQYFDPKLYFIENPKTGKMKEFIDLPYYDITYCKYSDWGYRKPTRIWTNKKNFSPLFCKNDCENMIDKKKHRVTMNGTSKDKRQTSLGGSSLLYLRYRIPPKLIRELLINN